MSIPFVPEFVQYGVIGICVALIVALVLETRMFVNAIMQFCNQIISLNKTISDLSAKIDTFKNGL
ncbi:hypothetical protein FACS189427_10090 [Planctomycetales bacterium]|nr:hypothetical protein FACS189427_10090 [Planctomycetales bacterium]